MKKNYVFPSDHLPMKPPVLLSAVLYMALDMYSAPGWLWGVCWTLMAIVWASFVLVAFAGKTKPLPGYGKRDE